MRRKRTNHHHTHNNHFWQSYSDLMAALLLVFILILSATLLQAQRSHDEQQQRLDDALATIDAKDNEIKQVLGIRQSIIDAMVEQFSDEKISVDPQTGAIIFPEKVLFDSGDRTLSEAGKAYLGDFIPRYCEILLDDKFIEYVGEITIVGHTDTKGSFTYNLDLSLDRARNVSNYILAGDTPYNGSYYPNSPFLSDAEVELLIPLLATSGRSWSDPIYYPGTTKINKKASRRVEIHFHLKDEDLIGMVEDFIS